jgi:hypothetical protein
MQMFEMTSQVTQRYSIHQNYIYTCTNMYMYTYTDDIYICMYTDKPWVVMV